MGAAKRRFCLILVKPSHYDDDGYVIQWHRSPIPSNSLASLFGLAKDCADRRILGDMPIDIHAFDVTNTRIRPEMRGSVERQRYQPQLPQRGRTGTTTVRAGATISVRCTLAYCGGMSS